MKDKSMFAAGLSLVSNALLTFLKIIVGVIFSSEVLIADGIHNGGDVLASLIAFLTMKISKAPADEEHPYGHGKAQVIGSALTAIIMTIASLVIIYESIQSIIHLTPSFHLMALIAAIVSCVWKFALYIYCNRIGKKTNSKALIATAQDHIGDVYASIAAAIGISLSFIALHFNLHFLYYGDPISGIVVSFFILKMCYDMFFESGNDLMEENLDKETIENFASIIKSFPDVKRIDKLRGRELGDYSFVDIRISVPAKYTVKQGHDLCKLIKNEIMKHDKKVKEVLIHLNPWE